MSGSPVPDRPLWGRRDLARMGVAGVAGGVIGATAAGWPRAGDPISPADFGARQDGTSDDTKALQAALAAAARARGEVRLRPGASPYLVSSPLRIADGVTLSGAGHGSWLRYTGEAALFPLTGRRTVGFHDFRLSVADPNATAFDVDGCFRCSWRGVFVEGAHGEDTGDTFHGQRGFHLHNDAGDNRIIDCDVNNFGIGIHADSVMNYVSDCDLGSNWRAIYGGDPDGAAYTAGLSVANTTIVSPSAAVTDHHVLVEGSANTWWFHGVWMEGADVGVEIGNSRGGPISVALSGCLVAASTTCLAIASAQATTLTGVRLSADPSTSPTPLLITEGNGSGFAAGILTPDGHVPASAFPASWTYLQS